ncbi:flavin reductase family protein [Pseudonocardia acaciae]|uniref:flavin reductase family protein n=1 Tax=Pseudonocardia acaciae TaxID=551276 RepID=UPI000684FAE3|nr:flavin reductase family protein [Pseudonocardia acaciae]
MSHDLAPTDIGEGLREAFVQAMGRAATGVMVVGASDGGRRVAQTVSSMCSVSAEPPLVLVCIHRRSPVNAAIARSRSFCVSMLATRHDHVADTFAGRPWPGKERWDFTCGDWEPARSGSPRLVDALAAFDCAVHSVVEAGSHLVYLGAVHDIVASTGAPLVYVDRSYARAHPVAPSYFPEFPDAHPDNRYGNPAVRPTPATEDPS